MAIHKNLGAEVEEEEEEEHISEPEAPIYGDVLESILTHVPLIHLLPAHHVSKSWRRAVSASLLHFNRVKPWLLLHAQATRPPYSTTTRAFDTRSRVWIEIYRPSIKYVSALRSSHSTLLYMLSPYKLSLSLDPLHLTWRHVDAPLVWRTDPIVAATQRHVVVAGGACDFEDDPLAVEIYNLEARTWETCACMPAILRDSASSTWLSIAVYDEKVYVTEKSTCITYSFDPEIKSWHGPYDLRPVPHVRSCSVGFSNGRLILIGLLEDENEELESVKVWELSGESFEHCREIGEMPKCHVEDLRGDKCGGVTSTTVGVNWMGDFVFINNGHGEVVVCELGGGECGWSGVRTVVDDGSRVAERLVFTCCDVSLGDLQRAAVTENWKFNVTEI